MATQSTTNRFTRCIVARPVCFVDLFAVDQATVGLATKGLATIVWQWIRLLSAAICVTTVGLALGLVVV